MNQNGYALGGQTLSCQKEDGGGTKLGKLKAKIKENQAFLSFSHTKWGQMPIL